MFEDFLENSKTYLALEQYWIQLFCSICDEHKISLDNWIIPFYNTCFSNQEKDMDGNPIFSAKSKQTGRIVRIIQTNCDEDVLEVWEDTFDGNEELVIYLTWSTKNVDKARSFIDDWLKKEILC